MFQAYPLVVQLLTLLRPVIARVRAHDRGLADQLQRAATSILLNLAEGNGFRGRNRRRIFLIALGSTCEVGAAIDAAVALGMIPPVNAELAGKLEHVRRVLFALTR